MAYSDTLRTDYVDAVWSGERKFRFTQNSDNTTSVSDVTEYSVEGDVLGSADFNLTNVVIQEVENASMSFRRITLPASGWSSGTYNVNGMALYRQIITVTAIYNEHPILSLGAAGTVPTYDEEAAYSLLKAAVANTSNNKITFYAVARPTTTMYIIAKEVK